MKPEIRILLEASDEDQCFEFPSNFNAEDIEGRARAVYVGLKELGYEPIFEDWIHNQDASFGLAIIFPKYQHEHDSNLIVQPVIRFSNFGNLATMTMLDHLPNDLTKLVPQLLNRHGFHYIPSHELEEGYDGVMAGDPALSTWWVRFFDWI